MKVLIFTFDCWTSCLRISLIQTALVELAFSSSPQLLPAADQFNGTWNGGKVERAINDPVPFKWANCNGNAH